MRVTYVTTNADLNAFHRWQPRGVVAYDTETTGLNIYSPDFRMRLLQLGDAEEAWVFPESHPRYQQEAFDFLMQTQIPLTAHNAPFDIAVLDRHFGTGWDHLFATTTDTYILAHLRDPAGDHGLKDVVTEWYSEAADSQKELKRLAMEEFKLPAKRWYEVFTIIPIDHPTYVHYAGYDTILSAIAYAHLVPIVDKLGMTSLSTFEHAVSKVTTGMQRRGMLIDQERAQEVAEELVIREERGLEISASHGIKNVQSPKQVANAFEILGAHLVEKTKSGAWKVDKAVLSSLIKLHEDGPIAELAQAVTDAKQAGRWKTTYVDTVLTSLDGDGKVHPHINSLRARTGRMAVDSPPLHQLPSGDALIRSMFQGPDGDLFFSVDYAQIEMKILAVMANEPTMIEAILSGLDLHSATANKMFGEDYDKTQRQVAKHVGFGKVYGGGATTIARQTGVTIPEAKKAITLYDRTYPGVKRYARYEMDKARLNSMITISPSGRRMPLDRDRIYAVTNYQVQSTARDILAQALLILEERRLDQYLVLPIHDEVIGSAPTDIAVEVATAVAEAMAMPFGPLHLGTEAEIALDNHWGTLYTPGGTLHTINR